MQLRFRVPEQKTRVLFPALARSLEAALRKGSPLFLVDQNVPLPFSLAGQAVFPLAGGEECKRWDQLERVLRWLASVRAERGQPLCVIGGGAVLDLGALAASLYRRGMPLRLVPTTLLGMVDASLGGKTAVDLDAPGKLWKNFAGTFYPAEAVWIFPGFLASLAAKERASGAGECLKALWIAGARVDHAALGRYVADGGVTPALSRLVRACLDSKRSVVERDPLDRRRIRELLNFGHTAGHALESLTGLSHGESVLWGMAVECTLLGARRGRKMREECRQAIRLLGLELPVAWRNASEAHWLELLAGDKKNRQGKIELSVLERPGKGARLRLPPAAVARAIREFPDSFPL